MIILPKVTFKTIYQALKLTFNFAITFESPTNNSRRPVLKTRKHNFFLWTKIDNKASNAS